MKTSSAPISTIVIMRGANQYFLRTLRKSQISLRRSRRASISCLENPGKIDSVVTGMLTVGDKSIPLSLQGIVTGQPHHISDGLKHKEENRPKNKMTIHPSQDVAKLHPALVRPLQ